MYFIKFYCNLLLFLCYNSFENPNTNIDTANTDVWGEWSQWAWDLLSRIRDFGQNFDATIDNQLARLDSLTSEWLEDRDRDLADLALDALRPWETWDIWLDLNTDDLHASVTAIQSEIQVVQQEMSQWVNPERQTILEARLSLYNTMVEWINQVISEQQWWAVVENVWNPESRARDLLSQYSSFAEISNLSRDDAIAAQEALNLLGYNVGEADGRPWGNTERWFGEYRTAMMEIEWNSWDQLWNAMQFAQMHWADGNMWIHESEQPVNNLFWHWMNTVENPWCWWFVSKVCRESWYNVETSHPMRAKSFIECKDAQREPAHVFFKTPDGRALWWNQGDRVCVQSIDAPIKWWVMPEDVGNPDRTYTQNVDWDEAVALANIPSWAIVVTWRGANS